MTNTFKVETANKAGIVERLLRVTRHRGFVLQTMNVQTKQELLHIDFSVVGKRPINQLFNQLEKLYDVKNISVS